MHCLTCEYDLKNLTPSGDGEHRCPECGRTFDPLDTGTFLGDDAQRYQLAYLLAIGATFVVGPLLIMLILGAIFLASNALFG